MIRPLMVGLIALVLAMPHPVSAQAGGEVRPQIEKMAQAWQKAYNAGDAAGVAALYTKDASLMAPGAEPVAGTEGIRAAFAADIKQGAKMKLSTEDVTSSGNYALETGKWVATSTDGKHLDHGQYVTFYKKTDEGWKIYRDIWNSSMASK